MTRILLVAAALALTGCVGDFGVGAIAQEIAVRHRLARARADARAREARNRPIWASARDLETRALAAAHADNCAAVEQIEQAVLALPEIDDLEGGFHDTVFLRHPEIVRCLAAQRQARETCTRRQALLAHEAMKVDDRDQQARILAIVPICPVSP